MNTFKKTLSALLLSLSLQPLSAQQFPFPQNVGYQYGYMSGAITGADAKAEYDAWLGKYYISCSSTEARINDNGITVSEGMGYGMVITAYAGDKEKFDKLWNYYRARRNGNGLMNWKYKGCETYPAGSDAATDGDLDAAMGLVVALHQWPGSGYETHAETLMNAIRTKEFDDCNGLTVQRPGDGWGGCSCTNPSYYAPGYYRVFAKYYEAKNDAAASSFWTKAASDAYITLLANQHPASGLITAWCNKDGGPASGCNAAVSGGGSADTYQYDACRGTWRVANDYLWWGAPDAKTFLTKVATFVKTSAGGITNIVDGYAHDGTPMGQWHNAPFVGSFALAGMATGQKDADEFLGHFKTVAGDNYFNTCLAVMYKFLATGNYWNPYGDKGPRCSRVDLGSAVSLCGTTGVELSAGVAPQASRTFTWKRDGQQIQSGALNSYKATVAGTYSVTMDSAGACSSSADVAVKADIPAIELGNFITIKENTVLDAGAEGPGLSYQWYLDGTQLAATAKMLAVTRSGTYRAVVSGGSCASVQDEIVADRPPYLARTGAPVTVDGTADAAFTKFRSIAKPVKGTPSATDCLGRWAGVWDNTNLYLYIEITDNTLTNDSGNWYEDDGAEVYIDGDDSRLGSYDKVNDYQWGFNWGDTKIGSGGSNASGQASSISFAIGTLAGGYTVEIAIPWTVIGATPAAGKFIAMEMGINDNDNGSGTENKLLWFGATDMAWQNPSSFAQVTLLETDPEAVVTQQIALQQGWNLVSLYVQPADTRPDKVFSGASWVKDQETFYSAAKPAFLNTLTAIEPGRGYFVYMQADETISLSGTLTNGSISALRNGWQLIGCPWDKARSLQDAFGTSYSELKAVKNFDSSWLPGQTTGLQTIDPGKGYLILK